MTTEEQIVEQLNASKISYTFFQNEFLFTMGSIECSIRVYADSTIEYRAYYPETVSKWLTLERNELYNVSLLANEVNRYNFFSNTDDPYRNISRMVLFFELDIVDLGFIGYHTSASGVLKHLVELSNYLKELRPAVEYLLDGTYDAADAIVFGIKHKLLPE